MGHDEIRSRYEELREELALAYRASEWDSGRIDAIADAMQPLERALASQRSIDGESHREHRDD